MFKNYIKIALRNIKRQKIYSLITMSGLILGLSVFIMFALLSDFTSNFDSCHENADRIYAVVQVFSSTLEGEQHSAITPSPMVPALLSEFPEIEKASRYFPPGRMVVKYQDKVFYESGVRFVDPAFLSIFTFNVTTGEKESVLSQANSIVMTEDMALKYFGDEDPVGKILTLDNKIDVVKTDPTFNKRMSNFILSLTPDQMKYFLNYLPHTSYLLNEYGIHTLRISFLGSRGFHAEDDSGLEGTFDLIEEGRWYRVYSGKGWIKSKVITAISADVVASISFQEEAQGQIINDLEFWVKVDSVLLDLLCRIFRPILG